MALTLTVEGLRVLIAGYHATIEEVQAQMVRMRALMLVQRTSLAAARATARARRG